MKTRLLFLFMLIGHAKLWAQDSTLVTVRAGTSIKEALAADIFLYPQFKSGKVLFKDGTKGMALMNYNSLTDQMLFIDPKGDSLALQDENTIKLIAVDKDTFYFDEGYKRQVANNSVVKLTEKKTWELADIRKIGSHNRPSTTFAVTSYSTVTDKFGLTHDLLLSEDLVLRKKATYYFGDKYNHFVPATKKNLLLLFPKKQHNLAEYFKENKVNFEQRVDLEKLAQFLAQNY